MSILLAEFQCWRCSHTWVAQPSPQDCPRCAHNYVTWLNYERDFVLPRGVGGLNRDTRNLDTGTYVS